MNQAVELYERCLRCRRPIPQYGYEMCAKCRTEVRADPRALEYWRTAIDSFVEAS